MSTGGYNTGINIDSRFPALLFIYKFFNRPGIILDGNKIKLGWGQQFVPAAPGVHSVTFRLRVWYGLLGVGSKTVDINVAEGQVTQVVYKPNWWLVFLKGKVEVNGQEL